jgi:hypothetical protein
MNSKRLYQLGGALVMLVAIILVSNWLSNRKPSEKSAKFFPSFTEATCSSISMTDAQGTVKLKKKGEVWVITRAHKAGATDTAPAIAGIDSTQKLQTSALEDEYPADSASTKTVLEKLTTMKKDILISENPSKQSQLEVDSAKGILIDALDNTGKSYGAFYIGKNGPDWSSNYIRTKGSNKVYTVGGSIRYSFFTEYPRWKDKTIIKCDRASIKKVSIVKQGTVIGLEKSADSAGTWKLTQPEQADAKMDVVNPLLDAAARLNTAEWEDSSLTPDSMGFTKPELVLTVFLANGEQKIVNIGKKKGGTSRFWVKAEGQQPVFLVDDVEIQKFDKKPEELKAIPPAAPADTTKKAAAPANAETPKKPAAKK